MAKQAGAATNKLTTSIHLGPLQQLEPQTQLHHAAVLRRRVSSGALLVGSPPSGGVGRGGTAVAACPSGGVLPRLRLRLVVVVVVVVVVLVVLVVVLRWFDSFFIALCSIRHGPGSLSSRWNEWNVYVCLYMSVSLCVDVCMCVCLCVLICCDLHPKKYLLSCILTTRTRAPNHRVLQQHPTLLTSTVSLSHTHTHTHTHSHTEPRQPSGLGQRTVGRSGVAECSVPPPLAVACFSHDE